MDDESEEHGLNTEWRVQLRWKWYFRGRCGRWGRKWQQLEQYYFSTSKSNASILNSNRLRLTLTRLISNSNRLRQDSTKLGLNWIRRQLKLFFHASSCKNKTTEINDLIVEKNADIIFISEIWLKDSDGITMNALVPNGFSIAYRNRKFRTNGGVAIIYRSSLMVLSTNNDFSFFESCHVKFQTPDSKVCFFLCIYMLKPW